MKKIIGDKMIEDPYDVRMQKDQRKKLSSVIPILKEVLETEEERLKHASGKMIAGNYSRMENEVKHFKSALELLESMLDYEILTDTGRIIHDGYRHEIVRKEIIESMEQALEENQRNEVGIIFLDNIKKHNGIYTVEGDKQYLSHGVFTFNVYRNLGKKGQKIWRVYMYKNNWYIEKRDV